MLFGELLRGALELVSTCSCTSAAGCPNCIQVRLNIMHVLKVDIRQKTGPLIRFISSAFFQSLTCSEYNEVLDKEAAIIILKVDDLFLLNCMCMFNFNRCTVQ